MATVVKILEIGYAMSSSQLSELWHYDMWLGHVIMDLPLRKCTATPIDLPELPTMDPADYQKLKNQVRAMWISARAHNLTCRKGRYGWGLFFSEEFEASGRTFTEMKPLVMGWLGRAPSPAKCPTGHRYLRSPCGSDISPIYLGGPISLANYDEIDRVACKRLISDHEPLKNKVGMFKAPRRKIVGGQEVLWSYNLNAADKQHINLHPESDWNLAECCSQVEGMGDFCLPARAFPREDKPSAKRRKSVGQRPLMSEALVTSFKFCTYCGFNLALESGQKSINMKRHWALKHTVQLCNEMQIDVADDSETVSPKDFIQHLDKVDHVFNSLNTHNYKVVPACNFFDITGTSLLCEGASTEQKEAVFKAFLAEGKSAFIKYQVVYLKGISIPVRYEDLLKPQQKSNYSDISWQGSQPSGINFSLLQYSFDKDETDAHVLNVKTHFTNIILGWM